MSLRSRLYLWGTEAHLYPTLTEPSQRPTTGRLPALLMGASTEAICPYLVLGSQASWGDSRLSEALGPRLSGWFPASADYHMPPSDPGFFLEGPS